MTDKFAGIAEDTWDELVASACAARRHAYAPYSGFAVGAAMLMESGAIYRGANIENASLGATVCAERNAIGNAVAHGDRRIQALAVVTDLEKPAAPCGLCRQVLAEFAGHLPIAMARPDGAREYTNLDDLLPRRFGPEDVEHGPDDHGSSSLG